MLLLLQTFLKRNPKEIGKKCYRAYAEIKSAVSKTSLEDTFENWASTIENEYEFSLWEN